MKSKKRRLSSASKHSNNEISDTQSTFTFKKGIITEQSGGKRRMSAKKINNNTFDKMSESVLNLTRCFICLCPALDPLKCPECNNFACKKCLDKYYGDEDFKQCPLCKKDIDKMELKEDTIIKEIEEIIYTENNNKIQELSDLLNEKKKIWENEANKGNNVIDRLLKYQEIIREYRKLYFDFFERWKKLIKKSFDDYENEIKELLEENLTQNENVKKSIISYDEIDKKNKNKYYGKDNMKSLINEILTLERKYFNDKKQNNFNVHEISPLSIRINLNTYSVASITIEKKDFNNGEYILKKGYNVFIGEFEIKLYKEEFSYKKPCKFTFFLKNEKDAVFFITQNKSINSKCVEIIPMKFKSVKNLKYTFEAIIDFEDFFKLNCETMKLETKVQIFSISNKANV